MAGYCIKPDFVKGNRGDLFVLDVEPASEVRARALYLPPHGEELNRCRSLLSAQARALAESGIACRLLDYYGSGDSDGDFVEGNWQIWQADILKQITDLAASGEQPVLLFGFRLGALCALDFVNQNPGLVQKLVLVQPVTAGKQYVTQLLRQRMAGQMGKDQAVQTTDEMRARLAEGQNLEIGGYEFGSQLLLEIDRQTLVEKQSIRGVDIVWMEFVTAPGKDVSIASVKSIEYLRANLNRVEVSSFYDPPVWQLHERENATANLQALRDLEWAV